jgi:two-component system, chemotaxis family, response regulator Rcp1
MQRTKQRVVDILLVEDNPADARLILEALKECHISHRLQVVEDGVEALAYLRRESAYVGKPRPHLILLDLNLPRMDGRDVLGQIKSNASLRDIPVVVLTTSQAETDIGVCYERHANCYVTKPVDLSEYMATVKSIENFWLATAKLPTR